MMTVCSIMKACRVARRLAVDNFQSLEITSACIVFISLLGQDTSLLRLHLQVANQLAEDLANQIAVASSNHQSSADNVDSVYDPTVTAKVRKYIVGIFAVLFRSTTS